MPACSARLAELVTLAALVAADSSSDQTPCELLYGRVGLLYAILLARRVVENNLVVRGGGGGVGTRSSYMGAGGGPGDKIGGVASSTSSPSSSLRLQSSARGEASSDTLPGRATHNVLDTNLRTSLDALDAHAHTIVQCVFSIGRAGAIPRCPLMFEWHGKQYTGAAHGLAGILHILLHFSLSLRETDEVSACLHYLIATRLPSGNYPSHVGSTDDRLVQWCHGAGGVAMVMAHAYEVRVGGRGGVWVCVNT